MCSEQFTPEVEEGDEHEKLTASVFQLVRQFYEFNRQIKASHGWKHVHAVYGHACQAVACHLPSLSSETKMEILVSSLLHDVDDRKYFPNNSQYQNARKILADTNVSTRSSKNILYMISLVSCSENGNRVPDLISETEQYHLLIPRWSDRLEAVGKIGVVRCYQYNRENNFPLSSSKSPRAQSMEELWDLATSERFEKYQETGNSDDMISHYYDKLLHVACPPKLIVRNSYLEQMAEKSAAALVRVCLHFGKTGTVDEGYLIALSETLNNEVER